ncbi:hypothetical protein F5Y10DRAFT_40794 [Nemania abortiva]|nr:hypothetical protein F5Y10DRAFT_40794 [Nemania abortiva]
MTTISPERRGRHWIFLFFGVQGDTTHPFWGLSPLSGVVKFFSIFFFFWSLHMDYGSGRHECKIRRGVGVGFLTANHGIYAAFFFDSFGVGWTVSLRTEKSKPIRLRIGGTYDMIHTLY